MTGKQITLTIDGRQITAEAGTTILAVCRDNGIDIPTLCYDPRLPPYGSCLLCVVEVEGRPNLALSCTTEAADGMKVTTYNERIYHARKNALEMLLSNHYADCRGPCYEACPADVDVQGYLALAKEGKDLEALELIRETNPLPLVCGRVCVRYCEANCRRKNIENPVAINFIKRYVADLEHDNLPAPEKVPSIGYKVAIVGGGPAGLTAAYYLAKRGYGVTIIEAQPKLGGMLRYGIPDYRLTPETLDKEIKYITGHGVDVRTGTRLGTDITLDDLKAQGFDAVLLALGAWTAKGMRVKNEDTPGVMGGIHFLHQVVSEGAADLRGDVVVVGGGNTAIDAARTALRCDAAKVTLLYRRTLAEMPADPEEIEDALEEGVDIQYLVAPTEVVRDEAGRVKALRCINMELGAPDDSGRRRPVPVEGSEHDVLCNSIIAAIGQGCDLTGIAGNSFGDVASTRWDTIVADEASYQTNVPWIFTAGDVFTGPKAAVDAIGAGRKSALAIAAFCETGEALPAPTEFLSRKTVVGDIPQDFYDSFERCDRSHTIKDDPGLRVGTFEEVDHGMPKEFLDGETGRCLSCGCTSVFTCELKEYAGEYHADQGALTGKVKKYKVDDRNPYITLDPNKCILCGRCVRTCEQLLKVSALGFVNRGFDMIVRPSMDKALQDTTCIACGNCIESCPTGAIDFRLPTAKPGPWNLPERKPSVCGYCGVGCEFDFNKLDDTIWTVTAKQEDAFSKGLLCARGRFGNRYLLGDNRLVTPRMKDGDHQKETNLDSAIDKTLAGLRAAAETHGPQSVAFLVSPKATNEETHLMERLARKVFGTNNVASLYDLARGDGGGHLDAAFGLTASTLPRERIEQADVIVVVNSDVTRENPVLGFGIKRAVQAGAELVSISSVETEITGYATAWLNARRGTAADVLRAAAAKIIADGATDADAVAAAEGYAAFAASLPGDLEAVAAASGVPAGAIAGLAATLADTERSVVFVYNGDATVDASPGDLEAIAGLLTITGRAAKPGNGLMLTREHSNSQGHYDLGAVPEAAAGLPGAADAAQLAQMMGNGDIKAVLIWGENFAADKRHADILEGMEFVAVADMFETATVKTANVAMPGSGYAESAGSVTSLDRMVRAFSPAFEAPAGLTGLDVLAKLYGRATDADAPSLQTIRAMIAEHHPRYADIAGLDGGGGFRWGGDQPFAASFGTADGKANLSPVADRKARALRQRLTFSTIDAYFNALRRSL